MASLAGARLADKWPEDVSFTMSPRYPKDIKLSDNLYGGNYRVVSTRLKEALEPLAGNSNIEFLPVSILNHKERVASKEYFIINPVDVFDCIDQKKAQVVWNAIDESVISSVKELALKKDVIPKDSMVFRPKYMSKTIVVRDQVVDQLSADGLSGLVFVEPSEFTA